MKFPQISYKKIEKVLFILDFKKIRQKGSHVFFKHEDGRTTIIPKHPNENINKNLLNKIIKKDLLISKKEFFNLI